MANQFSPNLQLVLPTPGDPLSENTWGTLLNTDWGLVDAAIAGLLTLSVAGSSNVVLTSNQGSADQERNQSFKFTGALTGDIYVLFPSGRTKAFSVNNAATGAFTLSVGVDNGSGLPAGTTVEVAQGASTYLVSDGTNVSVGVSAATPSGNAGGDLGGTYPNPTVTAIHLSAPLPVAQGGTGAATLAGASIVTGPASATANDIPKFSDTTGKVLADGFAVGASASNLVQLNGSAQLPAVDGSLLTGILGRIINVQGFTASGTYTKTAGATKALVFCAGPGGGGGAGQGTPQPSAGSGASSFGAHCSANAGGAGTNGGTTTGSPGVHGSASGGILNITGGGAAGGNGAVEYHGSDLSDTGTNGGNGGLTIAYLTSGIGATEAVTIGTAGSGGGTLPNGASGVNGWCLVLEFA